MSTLEKLVPPLAECKRIPAGMFEDSALVWTYELGKDHAPYLEMRETVEFCRRGMVNAPDMYPAPTTDEIGAAFPGGLEVNYNEQYVRAIGYECNGEGMNEVWCDEDWYEQKTPAAAALLLLDRVREWEEER